MIPVQNNKSANQISVIAYSNQEKKNLGIIFQALYGGIFMTPFNRFETPVRTENIVLFLPVMYVAEFIKSP